MAKWLPPIPSGALWSPAAIALGPALPLLAWCYDVVQGDGWADINLHTAAGDLSVPYPTVKRWWAVLRASEFFVTVDEKGRKGMRARFAEQWLERRILAARETGSDVIPNEAPKTETVEKRDGNGTETGSLLNALYIGTHDYQLDKGIAPASDDAAPPSKKASKKPAARKPKAEDDTTPAVIREALARECGAESARLIVRVNVAAKNIWARQQGRGRTAEQTAAAVPEVVEFLRETVYPFSEGQPVTPEAIDDRWLQAAQWQAERRRKLAALIEPTPPPADKPRRMTPAEVAAKLNGGIR